MKITYEAILDDPKTLERIMAEARRERSQAVARTLAALFRPVRQLHAARPHLARQG